MEIYKIQGGHPLVGEVQIQGAKNAVLGLLAAAAMADQDVTIHNVPRVDDIRIMLNGLKESGAKAEWVGDNDVCINGASIRKYGATQDELRKIRGGYYLVGAFLGKYHQAQVAMPGGCAIGDRPVDLHQKGFEALGATTSTEDNVFVVEADSLHGAHIYFDRVSVGATINTMMAATLAPGRTVLENVAREPHVVDVANLLNSMGARIKGAGMDIIRIDGVQALHGSDYSAIPDQIEAGTFMAMAAATGGDITVKNVIPKHLECISMKLREMGCRVEEYDDAVRVEASRGTKATMIRTQPYPGFPTDMQAQFSAALTLAAGKSSVSETIFENRLGYVEELKKMGAEIKTIGQTAHIKGVQTLKGADVHASDLRAGAALTIAALAAEGTSMVSGVEYINRGYEGFPEKIKAIGGSVEAISIN